MVANQVWPVASPGAYSAGVNPRRPRHARDTGNGNAASPSSVPLTVGDADLRVAVAPEGSTPTLTVACGAYLCYDSRLYGDMAGDQVRNQVFRAAISALARGKRVLDVGTGRDLMWAIHAVRSGAEHVVAIERDDRVYRQAAEKLARSAERDRIRLVHGSSWEVLPDRDFDVLIAEVIGTIGSAEGAPAVFRDIRRRMAPRAVAVPSRCVTLAAAASLRSAFPAGLAFPPWVARRLACMYRSYGYPFDPRLLVWDGPDEMYMSQPRPVEVLDFQGLPELDAETTIELRIDRAGSVDGILLWIRLSCDPVADAIDSRAQPTSWAPTYIPLFERPVPVQAGDALALTFRRVTSDDDVHPDYHVTGWLRGGGRERSASVLSAHHARHFRSHAVYRELFPAPVPVSSPAG
jgi:type I protein arginine methyltransferase